MLHGPRQALLSAAPSVALPAGAPFAASTAAQAAPMDAMHPVRTPSICSIGPDELDLSTEAHVRCAQVLAGAALLAGTDAVLQESVDSWGDASANLVALESLESDEVVRVLGDFEDCSGLRSTSVVLPCGESSAVGHCAPGMPGAFRCTPLDTLDSYDSAQEHGGCGCGHFQEGGSAGSTSHVEGAAEYMERHGLRDFFAEAALQLETRRPEDPYQFLTENIRDLVSRHLLQRGSASGSFGAARGTGVAAAAARPLRELSKEQQENIVRRVTATLKCLEITRLAAEKTFRQFAGNGGRCMQRKDFSALLQHWDVKWGLPVEHSSFLLEALKRWRFRMNAASGKVGHPLWPMQLDDFHSAYPTLLLAMRDRCMPFGNVVDRSLFIRQAAGKLADKYDIGTNIGRGAYGEVLLVTMRSTTERRVCKRVKRQQQMVQGERFVNEVDLLRGMDHPHIIRLFEYFESEDYIEMIMEPVFGGTLAKLVRELYSQRVGTQRPAGLREAWIATVMAQLAGALTYAHEIVGVIHKDLKSENVLLAGSPDLSPEERFDQPVHAMLADFGISEMFAPDTSNATPYAARTPSTRVGGTPSFMSPEMFKGAFTEKCDIWSLGVVFFNLLTGTFPYQSANMFAQAYKVSNVREHPRWELLSENGWSLGARHLCQRLLTKEELLRPSAADVTRDEWLQKHRPASGDSSSDVARETRDALKNQHLQSHLMRMARNCLTSQLSLAPLHRLNSLFEQYDRDGNGQLNHLEMRQVLDDAGIRSSGELDLIIECLDTDRSGFIEYSEFMAGCIDLANEGMRKHLRAVFDVFDLDGSGTISVEELQQVLTRGAHSSGETRPQLSQASAQRAASGSLDSLSPAACLLPDGLTIDEVMVALDSNSTGLVEYEEFERYILAEHARVVRGEQPLLSPAARYSSAPSSPQRPEEGESPKRPAQAARDSPRSLLE